MPLVDLIMSNDDFAVLTIRFGRMGPDGAAGGVRGGPAQGLRAACGRCCARRAAREASLKIHVDSKGRHR
jgi:hypothetical protein